MKIEDKREVADKVLAILKVEFAQLPDNKDIMAAVGSYQNGREQGHSLHVCNYASKLRSLWVAFSENRNSDNIVVYFGEMSPMQSITDEMYQNAYYFAYNEEAEAAKFIMSLVGRVLVDQPLAVPRKKASKC